MLKMKKIENYFYLIIGLLLAAISFNLFLAPHNLAAGGVSGLALIIHKLWNINESIFILVINTILLLLSYLLLGKEMTRKTILGSILFPIFIELTSYFTQFLNLQDLELLLIAILGGILSGIGYGLIFKSGFTSGGTDILNQIIEKYFHIPMATSIIFIDGAITLFGGFVFGLETMIYSFLALLLLSAFSNKKIIGIGENKNVYIYTTKYNEVKAYLHYDLKIDSTDFEIVKAYSNEKSKLIMTIIKTKDYYRMKEAIQTIDEFAFITVTNAYHSKNENLSIQEQ